MGAVRFIRYRGKRKYKVYGRYRQSFNSFSNTLKLGNKYQAYVLEVYHGDALVDKIYSSESKKVVEAYKSSGQRRALSNSGLNGL